MDRWQFLSYNPPPPGEKILHKQGGIRLYDGDSRSNFDDTFVDLSSHRLIAQEFKMGLDLFRVFDIEKEEGGFLRSDKIIVRLHPLSEREESIDRPVKKQKNNFIKLSFRSGGQEEFFSHLQKALNDKAWIPKCIYK